MLYMYFVIERTMYSTYLVIKFWGDVYSQYAATEAFPFCHPLKKNEQQLCFEYNTKIGLTLNIPCSPQKVPV